MPSTFAIHIYKASAISAKVSNASLCSAPATSESNHQPANQTANRPTRDTRMKWGRERITDNNHQHPTYRLPAKAVNDGSSLLSGWFGCLNNLRHKQEALHTHIVIFLQNEKRHVRQRSAYPSCMLIRHKQKRNICMYFANAVWLGTSMRNRQTSGCNLR